jgi:glyoxylase-like metal-dependent hydrolase (beta-lactamase superfamily II)
MVRTEKSKLMNAAILAGMAFLLAGVLAHAHERQTAASSAHGGAATAFEVYAILYATSPGFHVSSLVVGADPARTMDVPFMFWVLKGAGGRNVLVDAGSYRGPDFEKWKLNNFIKPSIAIGKVGLEPDQITDIIITHIHWDHMGGVDLFPKARLWIQRDEYNHYVDVQGKPRFSAIGSDDAALLMNLRKSGRLRLVEGDSREIIPGITVYTGGKHTYASQYVGVKTAAGTVVVASDNIYMYENLEKHLPLGLTEDRDADLRAQERMLTIASSPRLILPGHDPAVFERFPKPGDGVARIQ